MTSERGPLRRGENWLTVEDAATRVQRSKATIRRWAKAGHLTIRLGRIDERQLLEADRTVRAAARQRGLASLQAVTEVRTLGTTIPPACHQAT